MFKIVNDDACLWHKSLGLDHMHVICKLAHHLVKGLPRHNFYKDQVCNACVKYTQVRASFEPLKIVSFTRPLDLSHVDLRSLIRFGRIVAVNMYLLSLMIT